MEQLQSHCIEENCILNDRSNIVLETITLSSSETDLNFVLSNCKIDPEMGNV